MKLKLLLTTLLISGFSFAQFSTGTVTLTGANRTIKIDTNATTVTMTLTGSSSAWLGIGFGGNSMSSVSDMFIWNSTTNRDYTPSGGFSTPSADATQSWTITSDNVVGSQRTIVATRDLVSTGDYTFLNNNTSIPIIFSEGDTPTIAYHGSNPHAAQTLTRTQLGIEDFSLNASSIFPNPSNGAFIVTTKTTLSEINIYSQTGVLVKTIKVENSLKNAEVTVDNLQSGVYLIELKNDSEKSWKKVVVN